jgi:two-component system, NarL family, nitrate/nitrite response regulator NarL
LSGDVLTEAGVVTAQSPRVDLASGPTAVVLTSSEVLRRGLDWLLHSVPEIGAVRGCADVAEFDLMLSQERLGVVVIPVAESSWLNGRREILAEMDAVVLTVVDESSTAELSGAEVAVTNGFLWLPTLGAAEIRDALRQAWRGEVRTPPELVLALLTRGGVAGQSARARPANLTRREHQALVLLVRGMSNKQIARRLGISNHGAKRLVASIMLKLDSPNRTLAAVTAVRAGIVDERSDLAE